MHDTTNPEASRKARRLSRAAFVLFLAGVVLPVLCWTFWLPQALLLAAGGAEASAFILGVLSWRGPLAKTAVTGAAMVCLLGAWLGSHGFPTYPQKVHPTASWMKPLDSTWVLESPAKPYSIQSVADMKRNGEDSLRFELRSGDTWVDQAFVSTFRAEVSTEECAPANSVRWYALSVYFPTDFPIEDNRLLIAQWHSRWHLLQPGRMPPVAFRFINGQFLVTLRHSANRVIRNPEAVPGETIFQKDNFDLGRWHDFVLQAKWSCKDDGFVNIWWNGRKIVEYRGPVGYDEATGPFLKFGLYHDATDKTYVAYFNQVKSGQTAEDIGFDPSTATSYSSE
jgi:hypothetical protein